MSVRIRMKKLGRRHRPFFRICAIDGRKPRDGRVLEELGTYDPMVPDLDARAVLNGERINYWLGVGAQPSDNVKVLIKKYGLEGTHVQQQRAALDRLAQVRRRPEPPKVEVRAEAAAAEAPEEVVTVEAVEMAPTAEAPEEVVTVEAVEETPAAEAPEQEVPEQKAPEQMAADEPSSE